MNSTSIPYSIQHAVMAALAVLIVCFATCGNQFGMILQEEDRNAIAQTEELPGDEQESSSEEEYKVVAYEAVLPLVQANLSPLLYFFIKVPIILEDFIEEERPFHLPFISYFNTLFRLIISPNAP